MAPVSRGGRGWNDIAYNSGVCPHGYRLEGRGPGKRSGANGTDEGNRRSVAVCYIAGAGDPLTDAAKRAFHDEAARMGDQLWRQHGDWKSTECAGLALRAWKAKGWAKPGGSTKPPARPPAGPGAEGRPTLREGSTGPVVAFWQGLVRGMDTTLPADGIFGPATKRVTQEFQRRLGLTADGIVGPETWHAMDAVLRALATRPAARPTLRLGDRGDHVRIAQRRLNAHRIPVGVDGVFGARTSSAVKTFQRRNRLVADGVIGALTWAALG